MISFDINKVKNINLDNVRTNSWNPKLKKTKEYYKIKESIRREGQLLPVIVRFNPDNNSDYEIIDGQQRYDSLTELNEKEISIYDCGEVDDIEAKNKTLWYQLQVPLDNILLSPIVKQLQDNGQYLPFEDDKIEELLKLDEFKLEDYLKEDKEDNNDNIRTLNIKMNKEAYNIVLQAIELVKDTDPDNISDSRAIELICADYIGGTNV